MNTIRQDDRLLWREYSSIPARNWTAYNSTSPFDQTTAFSSDMAPSKGTYTFLMVLLMFFMCCISLSRFTCCAEHFFGRRADGTQATDHAEGSKKSKSKRTQEAIMKMLLLKKVTVLGAPTTIDIEKGMVTSIHGGDPPDERRSHAKLERRKSNLVLPSNTTTEDALDASRTCSICLCEYEHGDGICYSRNDQCVHRFHTNCAVAWFAKHEECPICRAQYLVDLSTTPTPTQEGEIPEGGSIRPSSDHPCPHHTLSTTPTDAIILPRCPIIVVEEEEEEGDIESNSSSMPGLHAITEDDILHMDSSSPPHPTDENDDEETTIDDIRIAQDDESSTVSSSCPSMTSCSGDTTEEEEAETGTTASYNSVSSSSSDTSTTGRIDPTSTTRTNTEDDMNPQNIVVGPENV